MTTTGRRPRRRSDADRMPKAPSPTDGRLRAWVYALRTTNPPYLPADGVTRWLVVTRAAVLPMTLLAGLVAALLAVGEPGFRWLDLALAVVGITVAHTANNLMNDLWDTRAGTDDAAYPRALYAPHPVLAGLVTQRTLVLAILAANVVDLAVLVLLAERRGWPVVALALAGLFLSFAYTAPPFRLKGVGLGEPVVLLVWGPLMVGGTYYAATGSLPWTVVLASLPYGLLCTTVLMGKHIDKIPYDAEDGTRTLPVLLGEQRARVLTLGLMVAAYGTTVLAVAVGALPWPALLALGGLPRLATVWGYFRRPRPDAPPAGFPVWPLWFAAVAFVHMTRAGGLLVLGLLVAAVLGIG